MADEYDRLVSTGAIGRLKREVLQEASEDVYYVSHLRGDFSVGMSSVAAGSATIFTVRLIRELIANEMCFLAMWGTKEIERVSKSDAELVSILDGYSVHGTNPFDLFLVATDAGKEWVHRYRALVGEL